MTTLTLVRHGTTEWMETGKLHGVTDSALSARGKKEATLTAQFLAKSHFDAFYTSPLGRAVETASIISGQLGMSPQKLDGLKERDFGIMEGRPHFGDIKMPALFKPAYLVLIGGLISITGEKRSSFKKRLFETACLIARQHPDQKVLVVVHAAVQSHLIAVLVDKRPRAWLRYNNAAPCSITELEILSDGTGRLLQFGVDEHLAALQRQVTAG